MSDVQVAARYAEAFYETAGSEAELGRREEDMATLADIFGKIPELRRFCLTRRSSRASEASFVEAALVPYVSETCASLIRLAVKNGRLACIPFLPEAFRTLRESKAGLIDVVLESFREADETLLETVREKMGAKIGAKVRVTSWRLPGLGGGFRILWRNNIIDLSLRAKVRSLRAFLKSE